MAAVMEAPIATVQPIILSGGAGTRLWPLSREAFPKQFLALFGEHSLLQQACERVQGPGFDAPAILANDEHRFLIGEQMQALGIMPTAIVLEPFGRNTAPAALVAALMAAETDPDKLILLLPSDHLIADAQGFRDAVGRGAPEAAAGHIVTFGVRPDAPETGYGYIEVAGEGAALDVVRFVEKPDEATAQTYVESGRHFWNAGIFLFKASTMVAEFERQAPDLLETCRASLAGAKSDLDFLRLDAEAYGRCRSISLDYAIMEGARSIKCVPLDIQWSDLGSWSALWQAMDKDDDGNVSTGDVILQDTRNSYVHTDDAAVCVIGLDDVFVVATRDAILVAAKDKAQAVKEMVAELKARGRGEVAVHSRVYRPWGWYEGLSKGDRFQVKCLMVKPGGRLSLQSHHHRSEHWVVVSGTAQVTVDNEVSLLTENQSTYIPLGARHRLENPGKVGAYLIEVQSGRYLEEDDIVRYEDVYNRG